MDDINYEKSIYTLTIEDLQKVADDVLNRKLTLSEIEILEDRIGDYIDWYSIIDLLIFDNIKDDNGTNSTTNN
ncbi:hypothetical protein [Capnocytophaga catalasegens]|uniref:Uncharacterized protein n=1 Tax=Capnocytophaga catalasegens TaxID=1004260 RepID=A0AAV5ATF6_9FLAO|nr:hypothetical protein [Capnocytophaga catalasegens]GIZ15782.1 hypothetical protein RCZ03_17820 [Capnocytophaga catalasegens]GJM49794.1 hypothetical protein RCZ15_07690 [Capnocytophaga catalasegens]GJM52959.1 hypothetical protein RCZ16_12760 [Capnocytophaga catalasegens]